MNSKLDELVAGLRRRKWVSLALVSLTLILGIAIGTIVTRTVGALDRSVAPGASPLSIQSPAQLSSAFVQISKAVRPTVVNINTSATVKQPTPRRRRSPRERERQDPFEEFFERFFEGPSGPGGGVQQRSLGSGIVVDRNGYILTNRHVVERADRIQVKLFNDPKQYKAKVIGSDKETDLAVIKIDSKTSLTPAKMGDSDGIQVGDWVLAIGSPFGLAETVTAGIISAKNRDLAGAQQFQHFLQTDAAINPGNSGGPLVNMVGEVVGVSTAIATNRGTYEGVGFALPSNTAVYVYNQIIEHGRVPRGSIGVEFQGRSSENEALLRSFGVKGGVIINQVMPGSPADQGGLKSGDVIVAVDDTPILSGDELVSKISETPVGEKVRIKYVREGKEAKTTITVAERTEVFKELLGGQEEELQPEEPSEAKFGLTLQNLTPRLASRLGLGDEKGVLVTKLDPGSFAEDAGLLRGDLIVELQREPVRSVKDLRRIQRGLSSGDDVVFKILRRGLRRRMQTLFLAGTLP